MLQLDFSPVCRDCQYPEITLFYYRPLSLQQSLQVMLIPVRVECSYDLGEGEVLERA